MVRRSNTNIMTLIYNVKHKILHYNKINNTQKKNSIYLACLSFPLGLSKTSKSNTLQRKSLKKIIIFS